VKERLIEAALCVGLLMPNGMRDPLSHPDYPTPRAWAFDASRNLSLDAKRRVARFSAWVRLHWPSKEIPNWTEFDGCYHLLYRRACGKPLPYPCDPYGPSLGEQP
jgi:hypothetical protein